MTETTPTVEKDSLLAELAGVPLGASHYGEDAVWHECLRSDDPYCWADPEEVAEAIVGSKWFAGRMARAWDEGARSAQCHCFAFSEGECACGNYPGDRNPYLPIPTATTKDAR